MHKDPSDVLKNARNLFREKNYSAALENYLWFYKNSTLINRAYIGVRMSYCLDEWADLAQIYQPAKKAMIEEKKVAVNEFIQTNSIDSFHDYATICSYLNCKEEPLKLFKDIHINDKELSKKMFSSVYELLALNKEWSICREYLGDCVRKYTGLIELFDGCIRFAKEKGGETGLGIKENATQKTKEEFLWLLNINLYADDYNGYLNLLNKLQEDLAVRGYNKLYDEILEAAPTWPT